MTKEKNNNNRSQSSMAAFPNPTQIRQQAEQKAKAMPLPDLDSMTHEEIRQMIDEMQIKQIEAGLEIKQLRNRLEEKDQQAALSSIITENMLDMVALTDMEGNFTFVGKAHEIMGYEPAFLIGKNVMDFVHPEDLPNILEEFAEFVSWGHPRRVEYRYRCEDGSYLWLETIGNFITDENGSPQKIVFSSRDITKRKQAEGDLQRIQWMLSSQKERPLAAEHASKEPYVSPYGDLTKLNTSREILYAVGEEALKNIVGDFLDLLDTSVAVYERNGDYALGIFSSDWCRLMDQASYQLCETGDSAQALSCGKWLCHESCWKTAKQSIETAKPIDTECEGGIRLYAVPIFASGEIIGTINVGYGDPPTEINKLSELAKKYGADVKDLTECSNAYESRPPFIIELAKRRIRSASQLIGEIVERKQAEEALRKSEDYYRTIFETSGSAMFILEEDTTISLVNSNFEKLSGYSKQEVEGKKSWIEFIHPDDVEWMKENHSLRRNDPRAAPVEYEFRFFARNDELHHGFLTVEMISETSQSVVSVIDITERKQAEEKVSGLNHFFGSIIDSLSYHLAVLNQQGRVILVNRAWREFAQANGIPAQQVSEGADYLAVCSHASGENSEEAESFAEAIRSVISGVSDSYSLEYPCHSPEKQRWFTGRITPFAEDAPRRVVVGHEEITDRKQAEKNLRESELRFQRMLSLVPDMISIHDKDLNIVYSNWNGFGAVPEERQILKTKCYKTYRGYDDTCPDCQAKTVLESRKPFQTEKQLPDGRWVDLRVIPLLDEMGDVELFMEWVRDITERKQAEASLRESEREKYLILNSTAEMIAYYDTDLRIIWINRAAADSVNMKIEDLRGRYCYEIWQQRTDPCPGCPVLAAKETHEPQQAEIQTYDGRFWSIRGYPIFNDEGDVSELVEFSQEITDQKNTEEMSARLQEQFNQAQKLESIGRLAGGVAHDLNNLLSPILGYGEMLLEDASVNDPRIESIEEIVSAGKRAQSLVRQLLAFSRKQPLQFQSLDINDLLKGFKKLLRRTLRENIKIKIYFDEAIPKVAGDAGQIEQVIMNLAVNAQDAMPDGGILTIETAEVYLDENYAKQKNGVTAGPYVMLATSDNGIGMDEDTFNHLFEPFFTTKEQGKGTGLGMSTAYGIIKQHGGNIWAYSEPGQGTTIKIYLPVPTKPTDITPQAEHRKPVSRGMETVLLAEDEQQVRNLTKAILERYGYQVIVAGNGQEALSALKKHERSIDLLITDVIMPDMNGKELYKKISNIYPETRVLFMSGYTDNVIAHHGVIDPGVNFIEKPFNVKALAAKVRQVLEK